MSVIPAPVNLGPTLPLPVVKKPTATGHNNATRKQDIDCCDQASCNHGTQSTLSRQSMSIR